MMPKANCLVFLGLALLSRAAIAQGGYTVLGDWPTTTKADVYWSPDGNTIVFSSDREGKFALYELAVP